MIETKELVTFDRGGSVGSIVVTITSEPICRVSVGSAVFEAADLFGALVLLRASLEKNGRFIACNGARRDVFPSGMAREMSRGRKAYILKPGVRPSREDLVDIFDRADADRIGTVSEQQTQFDRWKTSFEA